MADIYTPPPDVSYFLNQPFQKPDSRGDDRWAIAFDRNGSTIVTAALSVAITLAFMYLWNIIIFVVVFFAPNSQQVGNNRIQTNNSNGTDNANDTSNANVPNVTNVANVSNAVNNTNNTNNTNDTNNANSPIVPNVPNVFNNTKNTNNTNDTNDTNNANVSNDTNIPKVPRNTRRRFIILITLVNSDPYKAFQDLAAYAVACARDKESWRELAWGLISCILALAFFIASVVMGIIVPSLIEIDNVAPVRPSTLYYPANPGLNPISLLREFGVRAPSVLRALGSVEGADVSIRRNVKIDFSVPLGTSTVDTPMAQLNYSYSFTGVDFGLQNGAPLKLDVTGSCITEYNWNCTIEDPEDTDMYCPFNLTGDLDTNVTLSGDDIKNAPKASFIVEWNPSDIDKPINSTVMYAVIIHSAHRSSYTQGGDPWYITEDRTPDEGENPNDLFVPRFQMKRHRPALSCWENNSWHWGTEAVNSVYDLKYVAGIKIPIILLEVLELALSNVPIIVKLGNASGDSALRSRTTSPNGIIDAAASSMRSDMERLILGSFVATRNIFVDTTMFGKPDYTNFLIGADGQPAIDSGKFVVSSPDIKTFSMTGIVTLAVILVVLFIIDTAIGRLLGLVQGRERWVHFSLLKAVQLFRCVYEPAGRLNAGFRKDWPCSDEIPVSATKDSQFGDSGSEDRANFQKAQTNVREARTSIREAQRIMKDAESNFAITRANSPTGKETATAKGDSHVDTEWTSKVQESNTKAQGKIQETQTNIEQAFSNMGLFQENDEANDSDQRYFISRTCSHDSCQGHIVKPADKLTTGKNPPCWV